MPAPIQTNREKEIFEQALDLPTPERREAFLEAACGGDAALLLRVNDLLRVHTQAAGFLPDDPVVAAPRDALAAVAEMLTADQTTGAVSITDQPGDHIGRYKLLEKLGEGGFGVVYMAEQREPVKRRVALKIIKLGMDTREVVARFEAERQALALMDHPNIAKIFDGGVTGVPPAVDVAVGVSPAVEPGGKGEARSSTPEGSQPHPGGKMPSSTAGGTPAATLSAGRPYFVMELVRGIRITDYCDQNQLGLEERLKLFMQVCHAVQHAHQKGVIHRDLKPSNILVTLHDGVPVPKVIDFGIAKAMQQELTEKTLFTQFHQFIGTPSYMSPEQAELSGLDIDTRSDIYSLGVLLYELLAGKPPFDGQALLQAGLDEMRRTLREVEPPRPSTRLKQTRSSPPDAATKSTIPIRNSPIDPDLDWIVMKCLEKDRGRRYETASSLAADIQRHLNDEPIVARPPSALYQLKKMALRNRLLFTSATAVFAALAIGLGLSIWQSRERTRAYRRALAAEQEQSRLREEAELARKTEATQRAQAEANAKRAQTEAAKSKQVTKFLEDMLKGIEPAVALGRDTTLLRELLEKATEQLDKDLKDKPEVEAELCGAIGGVYNGLGDFKTAEAMHRRGLALRKRLFGEEHLDVELAITVNNLGVALANQKDWARAEPYMRDALAISRKLQELKGNEDPEVTAILAPALGNVAALLMRQGRIPEAEAMLREALELRRQSLGDEHRLVAGAMRDLARLLRQRRDFSGAEAMLREALAIRRKVNKTETPGLVSLLNELALVLYDQGKLTEAELFWREALASETKIYGKDHPNTRTTLWNLGSVLGETGKYFEAEGIFRQLLAIDRRYYTNSSPTQELHIDSLAHVLAREHKYAEAEPLYRELLQSRLQHLSATDEDVVGPQASLGRLLSEWAWAERTNTAAIRNGESPTVAHAHEAVRLLRECLAVRMNNTNTSHRRLGDTKSRLGGALLSQAFVEPGLRREERAAKIADTESLLLAGHALMKERITKDIDQGRDSLERLVRLYEAWHEFAPRTGQDKKAAEWRRQLADFEKRITATTGDSGADP